MSRPHPRPRRTRYWPAIALALLGVAGCSTPEGSALLVAQGLRGASLGPVLEGAALVPAGLISNNGGGLVSNNGGGLVSNNGGGIIAPNSSRYRLLAFADEVPLPEALVYLTDPQDNFFKVAGKMIATNTDQKGGYRLASNVPKGVPVIVNAILDGNRRITGFTVPTAGSQRVDLGVASTYVTEFLRLHAPLDNHSMGDYDLGRLGGLVDATQKALQGAQLAVPDLVTGHIPDLDRAYGLAVGGNFAGLGDAWAKLLGHRILASTTVAGSGNAGSGGDGGPAAKADMFRPRQVVADASGNLFIADEGNNAVRRVDAQTGVITTAVGSGAGGFAGDGGAASTGQLHWPRTVALDAAGNLYIGDQLNRRIRKLDARTGLLSTVAGNPDPDGAGGWLSAQAGDGGPATQAKLGSPRSLVFDRQGNLYIGDAEQDTKFNVVWKLDARSGRLSVFAGTPNHAGGYSGDGGPATQATLNYPNQLALDPQGRLLIADVLNHCIRRVDPATGVITTVAGVGGQSGSDADGLPATQKHLSKPYGIAVGPAPDNRLFIAEQDTGKLYTVGPDGLMRQFAGGGTDVRDGEAMTLKLTQPHDLWLEPNGNLLVADTRGSRIRRIQTQFGF